MLGKVLDNRYQIESVLGHGGMGMVFLATQTAMNRQVALKTLHPSLASAPQFFERFRREAEVASRLNHPNIVTIFDFGRAQDGTCYFVMELVNGESLKQLVKRGGPLTIRRAVNIIDQSARGLGHAHQMNVVHRDVKPHNILVSTVDNKDFTKILDFGLVKALENEDDEALTSTGQVLGTPQYMPPEQASGETVDARSDLFSLGGVLYYTLTGGSPWGANNVRKALTAPLTPLPPVNTRRLGAPIPKALEEFLRKALANEKADRHQSTEEFAAEMREALAGASSAELDAVPTGGTGSKDTGTGSESKGKATPSKASPKSGGGQRSSSPSLRSRRSPNVVVENDLAVTNPRATDPEMPASRARRGLPEGPSTAKKMALLAIPLVLFIAGGGVMVAMRRDSGAAQTSPTTVTTQVIPVDPPKPIRPAEMEVKLTSNPNGAEVYQGESFFGKTPLDLKLSRQVHALTFKLEGYTSLTRNLDLSRLADDRTTVDVALEPAAARPVTTAGKGKKKPPGPQPPDAIPVFE